MRADLGTLLVRIAGAAIAMGALAQVLVLLVNSIRRSGLERERRRLALRLLQHRLEAASVRRAAEEQSVRSWNGYRKFEVSRRVTECDNVVSFHLTPHDRKPLPPFSPGQHLTFRLNIPGQSRPVIRCYSLSDMPSPDSYRVTIKRLPPPLDRPEAPPGLASSHFHDHVRESDILDVRAPAGKFCLDLQTEIAVVLIGGGIGVTPLFSMLKASMEAGYRREVWFFLGLRTAAEHPWKEDLWRLQREHENLHLHVCYSAPKDSDVAGTHYHHAGHVSVSLLKRLLPSNNYQFFLCGPPAMMKAILSDLKAWGVPEESICFEAFGPASVQSVAPPRTPGATRDLPEVTFARSGRTISWNPAARSLLDFALQNGVSIDCGCRAGNCGTCLVAVKSGEVGYLSQPGFRPEMGSCLTCVSTPRTNLILDA